jgi:hypothetical protein
MILTEYSADGCSVIEQLPVYSRRGVQFVRFRPFSVSSYAIFADQAFGVAGCVALI